MFKPWCLVLFALVACAPAPAPKQEQVEAIDPVAKLKDSLVSLQNLQAVLKGEVAASIAGLNMRSVRDIERHEFVYDHDVFDQIPPYSSGGVFSDRANIYSGPTLQDSVIEVLPFKTKFNVMEQQGQRMKVSLYLRSLKGFVDIKDLYSYSTMLYPERVEIMMGQTAFAPEQKPVLKVILSKYQKPEKLGSFEMPLEANGCKVMGLANSLSHGKYVFVFVQSVGSNEIVDYYQYHEGAFNKILRKENQRLDSGYQYSSVYLPLKYNDGQIRHALGVPFEGIFNLATGKPNVFEVPDSLPIPLESLVIVQHQQGHMVVGNPGYEAYENQNEMVLIESTQTEYYEWDGNTLSLYTSDAVKKTAE